MDKPGAVAPASVPVKLIPTPTPETLPFGRDATRASCACSAAPIAATSSFAAIVLRRVLKRKPGLPFKASGRGTVLSYTVVHWSPIPLTPPTRPMCWR